MPKFAAAPPVIRTFEVTKVPQNITFNVLNNQLLNSQPFVLEALASSGLPISYQVVWGSH